MTLQQDLKSKLTTRNLAIMGAILIIAGNAFSLTVLNVRLHELLANVGALILVIGILQWFFDEDSRRSLIDRLCVELDSHLSRRDGLTRLGVTDCVLDSKALISEPWASELIEARVLAIGTHYSDGVVARFEAIIKMRIGQNKITQVLHSDPNGPAKEYLEKCLSVPVDLPAKVKRLQELVSAGSPNRQK